jgi:hypothetical protein
MFTPAEDAIHRKAVFHEEGWVPIEQRSGIFASRLMWTCGPSISQDQPSSSLTLSQRAMVRLFLHYRP